MAKMNLSERVAMIRAMDTVARYINDDEAGDGWQIFGIPDGVIQNDTKDEELAYLCEDKTFSKLMSLFLHLMCMTNKAGGLYCDGVVSEEGKDFV